MVIYSQGQIILWLFIYVTDYSMVIYLRDRLFFVKSKDPKGSSVTVTVHAGPPGDILRKPGKEVSQVGQLQAKNSQFRETFQRPE